MQTFAFISLLMLAGCVTADYSQCQQYTNEQTRLACEQDERKRADAGNAGFGKMFSGGHKDKPQTTVCHSEREYGTNDVVTTCDK